MTGFDTILSRSLVVFTMLDRPVHRVHGEQLRDYALNYNELLRDFATNPLPTRWAERVALHGIADMHV